MLFCYSKVHIVISNSQDSVRIKFSVIKCGGGVTYVQSSIRQVQPLHGLPGSKNKRSSVCAAAVTCHSA